MASGNVTSRHVPHLIPCHVCHRMLSYPPGAALLVCPNCNALNNLRGPVDATFSGQAQCGGCRQIMVFPLGSRVVQCTQCGWYTHTPAPEAYTCRCGLYVTYASTIATLMCTVCYTLRPPAAPVTSTLAPLTPLGISPAAAAALHAPYVTPAPLPFFRGQGTVGVGALPYDLLPSTPVLSSPGPRPPPIPRTAAHTIPVSQSSVQLYATSAAASAQTHGLHSSAASASSKTTLEQGTGQDLSPAEVDIQTGAEQQRQASSLPQEIEPTQTPERTELVAGDSQQNGAHEVQESAATSHDPARSDDNDNGQQGVPHDLG